MRGRDRFIPVNQQSIGVQIHQITRSLDGQRHHRLLALLGNVACAKTRRSGGTACFETATTAWPIRAGSGGEGLEQARRFVPRQPPAKVIGLCVNWVQREHLHDESRGPSSRSSRWLPNEEPPLSTIPTECAWAIDDEILASPAGMGV